MIPISVIMTVKNEAINLIHSLPPAVKYFKEVIVVDSHSQDTTAEIAKKLGATILQFNWNGFYPKKRQWCLDNLYLKNDWILMLDADEIITEDFIKELQTIDFNAGGYFVRSQMVWKNKLLQYGLNNNKLCLFKRSCFSYPIVDDLSFGGMGEIEGHYQPIPKTKNIKISSIKSKILHHNYKKNWKEKHLNYYLWEVSMNKNKSWPKDPIAYRQFFKSILRQSYLRPVAVFIFGYFVKLGFLDGLEGFDYALKRTQYAYQIVHKTRIDKP
jgi:glycosyltransferase involved in cell wall biosynthesis